MSYCYIRDIDVILVLLMSFPRRRESILMTQIAIKVKSENSYNFLIQIIPIRISLLYQIDLPLPAPLLHLLFP